jgi:hypothetical protein
MLQIGVIITIARFLLEIKIPNRLLLSEKQAIVTLTPIKKMTAIKDSRHCHLTKLTVSVITNLT